MQLTVERSLMINESKAFLFNFDSPKMILSLADTSETLVLGEHEEDALNEVSNIICSSQLP